MGDNGLSDASAIFVIVVSAQAPTLPRAFQALVRYRGAAV